MNFAAAVATFPPSSTSELVLICIKDSVEAPLLIEAGRALADRLAARWTILHVETAASAQAPDNERHRLTETLRAAELLGGTSVNLAADDAARAIVSHARAERVTHIVVGAPRPPGYRRWRRAGIVERVGAGADGVCLRIVSREPGRKHLPQRSDNAVALRRGPAWAYLVSLAMVAAATSVSQIIYGYIGVGALSVIFLTAVLLAATEYGLGPALFASVLSMLSYDFFFFHPRFSLLIEQPRDVTSFCAFTVAALIASRIATRLRTQAYLARRRAADAADLHQMTRGLAGAATLGEVAQLVAERIAAAVERPVAVLLGADGDLWTVARQPPHAPFGDDDRAAASSALLRQAGARSAGGWRFLPIRTSDKAIGAVGVLEQGAPLDIAREHRLSMIADQAAIAVDRINLVSDLIRERERDATDRLHAALLASISHDLRVPLTAILGSAETLAERWHALPEATRRALAATVKQEAEALSLLVNNLLDMARLEGTAFRARLGHADLADVIDAALRRTEPLTRGLILTTSVQPDLPAVMIDPVLFEQVLFNIIDNASRFAPPGSEVRLSAWRDAGQVHVVLTDEGPGFPPDRIGNVFDKFFHIDARGQRKGAGLGLTICRGFVVAMAGEIVAQNRTDRPGALVRISLPVPAQAAAGIMAALQQ